MKVSTDKRLLTTHSYRLKTLWIKLMKTCRSKPVRVSFIFFTNTNVFIYIYYTQRTHIQYAKSSMWVLKHTKLQKGRSKLAHHSSKSRKKDIYLCSHHWWRFKPKISSSEILFTYKLWSMNVNKPHWFFQKIKHVEMTSENEAHWSVLELSKFERCKHC